MSESSLIVVVQIITQTSVSRIFLQDSRSWRFIHVLSCKFNCSFIFILIQNCVKFWMYVWWLISFDCLLSLSWVQWFRNFCFILFFVLSFSHIKRKVVVSWSSSISSKSFFELISLLLFNSLLFKSSFLSLIVLNSLILKSSFLASSFLRSSLLRSFFLRSLILKLCFLRSSFLRSWFLRSSFLKSLILKFVRGQHRASHMGVM